MSQRAITGAVLTVFRLKFHGLILIYIRHLTLVIRCCQGQLMVDEPHHSTRERRDPSVPFAGAAGVLADGQFGRRTDGWRILTKSNNVAG